MQLTAHSAPGAPGATPRWTSSAKDGVGTAYNANSRVWFTLSHGVLNEIYCPHVDSPATRDFGFLISDGESFVHEEKRDLHHAIEMPERGTLLYRLTNAAPGGRYRLVKEVIADPHRSVVLVRVRLEVPDETLRGKLRLYALLTPRLEGRGEGNTAYICETAQARLLRAERGAKHLVLACGAGFSKRSAGFVGVSDGWQDLHKGNFQMDWQYLEAAGGNVALTGEVDFAHAAADAGDGAREFTVAIGFGDTTQSAATCTLQALATPWPEQRAAFVTQWQRAAIAPEFDFSGATGDDGGLYRLSRNVLLAHEDKAFEGAITASLSTPWGETKTDADLGGYHLVWTRDLVQSATALLATGQTATPLRALIWLACIQEDDGSFPQNSWIDGRAYWGGIQLDEMAAPLLLAWRLREADALGGFDPWPVIERAAAFLVKSGPVTGQDRWEENAGYSPFTLATTVAGLVCAAEFARAREPGQGTADFLLTYADWLNAHVEDWCATSRGELVPGKPRHFVRITPADPTDPDAPADPDHAEITLGNAGGTHPARNIVGGDFLQLVRLGLRAADDPLVRDSVAVLDATIKRDLPDGPGWRRYPFDGYGQKPGGAAYDGTGEGRCWPILTGERGHYELAAGRDPRPFVEALEKFANAGNLLPEQLWDDADTPDGRMRFGRPSGSAMPLCWSHAEYLSLVRSAHDGRVFDRVEPAWRRYVENPAANVPPPECWTFRHRVRTVPAGGTLRLIVEAAALVRWSPDGWQTVHDLETTPSGLPGLWFADLPADGGGGALAWTFCWVESGRWEGENFQVALRGADGSVASPSELGRRHG